MTFSRQLIFLLITVILLLLVISLTISFMNTRQYVESQLSSHAQDAATSLGMSASSAMKDGDQVIVQSLVDAMFHAGDYQQVVVYDVHGKQLIKRQLDVKVEGIPHWFIDSVPLHLPVGEAVVMDGWVQAGKVQISSHPGYAYRQLWEALIDTFKWFLFSALVVLLLSLFLLKRLLYPLKQVEIQANAIAQREFMIVEPLPKTLELKRIVHAMNHLGRKVKQMLSESDELAQRMRDQSQRDSVTGLANRQHFNEVLGHRVGPSGLMEHAALALVQLQNFKQFNDKHGYAAGDNLLKKTAEAIKAALKDTEKVHIARLAGASFVVLVEDLTGDDVKRLGKSLSVALTTLTSQLSDLFDVGMDIGHIGIARYTGNQSARELLSMADTALRDAEVDSANGWAVYKDAQMESAARTATQWREYICMALEQDWLVVQRQAVFRTADQSVLQEEVFVRLADQGDVNKLLNAGAFMPMAHNLGLATAIDRRVIEIVLGMLQAEQEGNLVVNLSPMSLDDKEFIKWLVQIVAENRASAYRLVIEFPEYGIIKKIKLLNELMNKLSSYGVQLSLDHFGRGFSSFAYLQSLKLNYLKIDGSYLKELEANAENRFFVQALSDIAHGLDVTVVAESVETEAVWNLLPTLKVDAGQGYYLARPK